MKTVSIHFLHGSVPGWKYKKGAYTIRGGLLGGHIYIQLNKDIFGFEPFDINHFHIIPRSYPAAFNSMCKHERYDEWITTTFDKKFTTVVIPLKDESFMTIKNDLEKNVQRPSFDYALFGMRCGSFTHYYLSKIQVVKKATPLQSMLKIPCPRRLRSILTKKAAKKEWEITKSKGSHKRIWEGK